MTASPLAVSARNIVKSFGATRAVRDVSLDIPAGTIFGLVGENGAGKSTFAKILAGIHSPDSGDLIVQGQPGNFRNPYEGIRAGVSMMAQEILLVPEATVEENVLLGNLPSRGLFPNRALMRRRFNELLEFTQFDLAPTVKVGKLRIADQQKVEMLRALSQDARLIIMDEPSAALTTDEVERLHASIRKIAQQGASVLLISHFLEEVLALTQQVAIMRDGELIRTAPTHGETVDSLVASMVGKALATDYKSVEQARESPVRLRVRGLTRPGVLDGISFDLHEGEILGLAGLIGSGRTEIARCIFGVDRFTDGLIEVDGEVQTGITPTKAITNGVFMVPESRKEQGLVLVAPISDNLVLASIAKLARLGVTSRRRTRELAKQLAEKVDLRFTSLKQSAGSLSGGNQQKILFGRAYEVAPKVLIVDEPTRGVDIAAKRAIHATLEQMAEDGTAILFISSEIEEVLGVCNRVLVIHRGQVQAEFSPPYSQETIVSAFFGKSGMPHD